MFYARSPKKKNTQSHLTCGVLYWYIHSGSDEEPGFLVFLALSSILSPVSGESGDLYIIRTLSYVVTPRLAILPPVARIEYLLDEQLPQCM